METGKKIHTRGGRKHTGKGKETGVGARSHEWNVAPSREEQELDGCGQWWRGRHTGHGEAEVMEG